MVSIETRVKESMQAKDADTVFVPLWAGTLHHTDDLPINPKDYFPQNYLRFKGAVHSL
jgi:hypothetical protein